ncbi:hypothetical protein [Winogradskyella poriferorum]|uniref:Uncharacterized protein n=1 Tax=Winogradskyella poriferorum TaxID=307627 RepID=A0ABU7W2A0_9FLAO
MKPNKRGQIVKFHTPYEDEDPNDRYVTMEVIEDGEKSRARIYALNTGMAYPPISMVPLKDLEVDELMTDQLDYYLKYGNHNLF